ncbi:MAG: SIR2 family protein [Lentisphaeria bacterium]|nr:SIR2 family protein [Lentisphaeria bacterium]
MTKECIDSKVFVRDFTKELHNNNVAVFAGAGLSMASGYVDWTGLLREIIEDLKLDPEQETDLVTLAQYHCNQAGNNKSVLTQRIFEEFSKTTEPTENHRILSRLPIQTYWTSNYDKLIETAIQGAKKVPDVKYTNKQLAVTRPDRDVIVYKMHGDVEHASDAVISKDDYEEYPFKMGPFVTALRGDLVEKTFLFLGFSFTDPNLDYILSRVRVQYERNSRQHFCIQRAVTQWSGELDEDFQKRKLKQEYFIQDLKRFGIKTVLVAEYSEITELLKKVEERFKRKSIFIAGAAHDFSPWDQGEVEEFCHKLSYRILQKGNRVVTGFGLGVGGPVINGALAYLNDKDKTVTDEHIMMRPFPQVATGGTSLADRWRVYRESMVQYAGIAVFLFGNKEQGGTVVPSNGMRQEFEIAVTAGLKPLPVGATGYMARELWNEVLTSFDTHFPGCTASFRSEFQELGNTSLSLSDLENVLIQLIEKLQRG